MRWRSEARERREKKTMLDAIGSGREGKEAEGEADREGERGDKAWNAREARRWS